MRKNREYEAIVNKVWQMYYTQDKTITEICKIVCGLNEKEVKKMLGIREQPQCVQQVG